jgi:hypothetical protein
MFPIKSAATEKSQQAALQRGTRMVEVSRLSGGRYHSRAARDDRDGGARYSADERQGASSASRVEPWS